MRMRDRPESGSPALWHRRSGFDGRVPQPGHTAGEPDFPEPDCRPSSGGASTRSADAGTFGDRAAHEHLGLDLTMAGVDHVSASDREPLTARERAVVGIVARLQASGDPAPIAALVRDGGEPLDCAREALEVLGELDPQLLVRVALDALAGEQSPPSQNAGA